MEGLMNWFIFSLGFLVGGLCIGIIANRFPKVFGIAVAGVNAIDAKVNAKV